VRNHYDLCVLLPLDLDGPEIKAPVDQDIVRIVQSMSVAPPSVIPPNCVGIEELKLPPDTPVVL
jgi:hypothetical protein